MASSSADCVFGGVRLISSARSTLAKIGPCTKVHVRWPGDGIFFDDVGAGDIGRHQIGRELDALEDQAENLGHGSHEQRFRRSRQTGDQAVAADEQPDADLFHHFVLADDHAVDLPDDLVIDFAETRNSRFQNIRFKLRDHGCGHGLFSVFAFAGFYFSGWPVAPDTSSSSFWAGRKSGATSSAETASSLAWSFRPAALKALARL